MQEEANSEEYKKKEKIKHADWNKSSPVQNLMNKLKREKEQTKIHEERNETTARKTKRKEE